jgi:hypothetical protein
MTPERWQAVKNVLAGALERTPGRGSSSARFMMEPTPHIL